MRLCIVQKNLIMNSLHKCDPEKQALHRTFSIIIIFANVLICNLCIMYLHIICKSCKVCFVSFGSLFFPGCICLLHITKSYFNSICILRYSCQNSIIASSLNFCFLEDFNLNTAHFDLFVIYRFLNNSED